MAFQIDACLVDRPTISDIACVREGIRRKMKKRLIKTILESKRERERERVCVCVFDRQREREREREREKEREREREESQRKK